MKSKITKKEFNALQQSVQHWHENVIAAQLSLLSGLSLENCGFSHRGEDCHLCHYYINCRNCLIYKETGYLKCYKTPYTKLINMIQMSDLRYFVATKSLVNRVIEESLFLEKLKRTYEKRIIN